MKFLIILNTLNLQPKLEEVINEVKEKMDAVYVFGIGPKVDLDELKLMASKDRLYVISRKIITNSHQNLSMRLLKAGLSSCFEYIR